MTLSEAHNLVMKAGLLMPDKFKSEVHRRSSSINNYQPPSEKFKLAMDNTTARANKFKEKAARKQKEKEATGKEVQKNLNSYAKPYSRKCFMCD